MSKPDHPRQPPAASERTKPYKVINTSPPVDDEIHWVADSAVLMSIDSQQLEDVPLMTDRRTFRAGGSGTHFTSIVK